MGRKQHAFPTTTVSFYCPTELVEWADKYFKEKQWIKSRTDWLIRLIAEKKEQVEAMENDTKTD